MSPDAPAFTAINGRLLLKPIPPPGPPGPPGGPPGPPRPPRPPIIPPKPPPVPTYNNSSLAIGDALAWPVMPPSSQSCLPVAGSYDRTVGLPRHTTSVRTLFFHTNGVLQPVRSGRSTRQSSSPLLASSAARNDFCSLSHWMKSRPSANAGELPVPNPIAMGYDPRSFFHTRLPARSKQYTPCMPK